MIDFNTCWFEMRALIIDVQYNMNSRISCHISKEINWDLYRININYIDIILRSYDTLIRSEILANEYN